MSHRTPYSEDHLRVKEGTTPEDIQDFTLMRATNPVEVGEKTVWNFNNHEVNTQALENQDLMYSKYIIPFQASGVWAVMFDLLPERLRKMEILTYSQTQGRYVPFPSYYRHSDDERKNETTDGIREYLDQNGI